MLRDTATIELVRTIIDEYGGAVRGDDPAVGSLAVLWQSIVASLEELRNRVVRSTEPDAAGGRPNIVRQAIQARLGRRRR